MEPTPRSHVVRSAHFTTCLLRDGGPVTKALSEIQKRATKRERKVRKYLAVFLLLIMGGAFAKTIEEGVNINSFMDAVSYLKAAIDLGANKGCFDSELYANSISVFLDGDTKYEIDPDNYQNKVREMQNYHCVSYSTIVDSIHGVKDKIFERYGSEYESAKKPESDWKKLPTINPVYYTQDGASKVALSVGNDNHIAISMFSVNPDCDESSAKKQKIGQSFMYINKVLVKLGFLCNGTHQSIYFPSTKQGRIFLLEQFSKSKEVCFGLDNEIRGICFSAIGFNEAKAKLMKVQDERKNAL